ncbi:MAG: hypothetical protein FJ405_03340 [Verrucomicrobia bacterium]|nr:hypothetical protein [Verrucomicrobiota bacterium]
MNPTDPAIPEAIFGAESTPPVGLEVQTAGPRRGFLVRWGLRMIKLLGAMVLVQSVLGALAVLGWAQRRARTSGLRVWEKANRRMGRTPLLVQASSQVEGPGAWGRKFRVIGKSVVGCFREGFQTLFNACVLTLPWTVLMQFAWYDGWNNSFNKGYEHAAVGPAASWIGIFGFIAAMFLLPMCMARQTMSCDWRRFYDFRLVWKLVRRDWLCHGLIAASYALLSVPLTVLKIIPGFLPQINRAMDAYTPQQAADFLGRYWWMAGGAFVVVFFLLRLASAKAYARSLLDALQSGAIGESDLSEAEWRALHRLDLVRVVPPRLRPPWLRAAAWAGSRMIRLAAPVFVFGCWGLFVFQTYLSEFFIHHPWTGFALQPLVQLPIFSQLP